MHLHRSRPRKSTNLSHTPVGSRAFPSKYPVINFNETLMQNNLSPNGFSPASSGYANSFTSNVISKPPSLSKISYMPSLFNFQPQRGYHSSALRRRVERSKNVEKVRPFEPLSSELVQNGLRILSSKKRVSEPDDVGPDGILQSDFNTVSSKRRRTCASFTQSVDISTVGCIKDTDAFSFTSLTELTSGDLPVPTVHSCTNNVHNSPNLSNKAVQTIDLNNKTNKSNPSRFRLLIPSSDSSASSSHSAAALRRKIPYMSALELEAHLSSTRALKYMESSDCGGDHSVDVDSIGDNTGLSLSIREGHITPMETTGECTFHLSRSDSAVSPTTQSSSCGNTDEHPKEIVSSQPSSLIRFLANLEDHAYCNTRNSSLGKDVSYNRSLSSRDIDSRVKRIRELLSSKSDVESQGSVIGPSKHSSTFVCVTSTNHIKLCTNTITTNVIPNGIISSKVFKPSGTVLSENHLSDTSTVPVSTKSTSAAPPFVSTVQSTALSTTAFSFPGVSVGSNLSEANAFSTALITSSSSNSNNTITMKMSFGLPLVTSTSSTTGTAVITSPASNTVTTSIEFVTSKPSPFSFNFASLAPQVSATSTSSVPAVTPKTTPTFTFGLTPTVSTPITSSSSTNTSILQSVSTTSSVLLSDSTGLNQDTFTVAKTSTFGVSASTTGVTTTTSPTELFRPPQANSTISTSSVNLASPSLFVFGSSNHLSTSGSTPFIFGTPLTSKSLTDGTTKSGSTTTSGTSLFAAVATSGNFTFGSNQSTISYQTNQAVPVTGFGGFSTAPSTTGNSLPKTASLFQFTPFSSTNTGTSSLFSNAVMSTSTNSTTCSSFTSFNMITPKLSLTTTTPNTQAITTVSSPFTLGLKPASLTPVTNNTSTVRTTASLFTNTSTTPHFCFASHQLCYTSTVTAVTTTTVGSFSFSAATQNTASVNITTSGQLFRFGTSTTAPNCLSSATSSPFTFGSGTSSVFTFGQQALTTQSQQSPSPFSTLNSNPPLSTNAFKFSAETCSASTNTTNKFSGFNFSTQPPSTSFPSISTPFSQNFVFGQQPMSQSTNPFNFDSSQSGASSAALRRRPLSSRRSRRT